MKIQISVHSYYLNRESVWVKWYVIDLIDRCEVKNINICHKLIIRIAFYIKSEHKFTNVYMHITSINQHHFVNLSLRYLKFSVEIQYFQNNFIFLFHYIYVGKVMQRIALKEEMHYNCSVLKIVCFDLKEQKSVLF